MPTEKKLEGAALEEAVDRVLKDTRSIGCTVLQLCVDIFVKKEKPLTREEFAEYVDATLQSRVDEGNTQQAVLFGITILSSLQCSLRFKNPAKAREVARRICELDAEFSLSQAKGHKDLDFVFYALVGLLLIIGLIIWWIVA